MQIWGSRSSASSTSVGVSQVSCSAESSTSSVSSSFEDDCDCVSVSGVQVSSHVSSSQSILLNEIILVPLSVPYQIKPLNSNTYIEFCRLLKASSSMSTIFPLVEALEKIFIKLPNIKQKQLKFKITGICTKI